MDNYQRKSKIAVVQSAPVYLDKNATVEKVCRLIAEAGKNGAELLVFPEAFISGYPDWIWMVKNSDRPLLDDLYFRLVENAVTVGDEATKAIGDAARQAGVIVAVGVHECNSEASGASLYNSVLYFGADGNLLGKHRKLIPTAGERTIWAQGDGSTLQAYDTQAGKLGGLICWENYMPLAREAMYRQGVQIFVAPTWDSSEGWLQSLQHIAREGGMYVVGCCTALHINDIPDALAFKTMYPEGREWINPGNCCIIDPRGKFLAGPLKAETGILYAETDTQEIAKAKRMFDVAGHYARPDVFRFAINES